MKKIVIESIMACVALMLVPLLTSCSEEDYLDAIPRNSTALVAIDAQKLIKDNNEESVKSLLRLGDIDDCGIDFSAKLYFFETVEGNIGMSAKVSSGHELSTWFDKMSHDGYCKAVSEYKDYRFTVIKDSWVVGFSDEALVALGPSLPSQQAEARQNIVKYLSQEAGDGIKDTPMFDKLDSIKAPIALVAQARALPDKFVAPFTIGAPKDADASQIMIAAEFNSGNDGCFIIRGETFSLNKEIDKELKSSKNVFRPIKGKYVANMPSSSMLGVFMNVDGSRFIKLLHSNKTFQALLAGMNTAIDMDNIIKSIDGDVAIILPDALSSKLGMQMCAQLGSKDFLDDVGYWKQSCPAGSKITDWGDNSYCYTGAGLTYYFGVSKDMQFYSGSTDVLAKSTLSMPGEPLPVNVQKLIKGQRMAMVLNISTLVGNDSLGNLVKPLLGGTKTILYIMK